MKINSQSVSLAAMKSMDQTQKHLDVSLKQLATGSRFANAGVDAAGQAIAENMQAQIKGFGSASMNAQNAQSLVQHAEVALNEQNNILIRLRELAVQSASDTFSETERSFLNTEYTQLVKELDRIAKTTRFGSQNLLDGSERTYEFHVGVNKGPENVITFQQNANTTADELGIDGTSIDYRSDARDSLDSIDEALEKVGGVRARLGAVQSRLDFAINNIESQKENLVSAHSKIADTDVAQAVSELRRAQVLQQYQVAVLAAVNESDTYNLKLIA